MAQTLTPQDSAVRQIALPALRMDQKVLERLTNRQRQILAGLVDGKTSQELAKELGLSPSTIRHESMRIYGITEELFGPGTRQDLVVEQSNEQIYELPVEPVELAGELKNLLARETTKVSSALTLALQDRLGKTLSGWFEDEEITNDLNLLRKLANSVSSAGPTGAERTKEALDLVPQWDSLSSKLSRDNAVGIMRDETSDFRKAKSYLNNQAKFVNAFLKFYLDDSNDLSSSEKQILDRKVESFAEFRAWSVALSDAWMRARPEMEQKNHKLYQSYWMRFTDALITKGLKQYSLELVGNVENYLSSETDKQSFIQNLGRAEIYNRNAIIAKPTLQSTLKVEGDQIAIHARVEATGMKVLQMKEDFVFLCAQDALLRKLEMEIDVLSEGDSTLIVRFTSPKELVTYRRAIDSINQKIKQAFESN